MMKRHRRHSIGGQAIVEYLTVATVVVLVILAASPQIRDALTAMYNNAAAKASEAAGRLSSMVIP